MIFKARKGNCCSRSREILLSPEAIVEWFLKKKKLHLGKSIVLMGTVLWWALRNLFAVVRVGSVGSHVLFFPCRVSVSRAIKPFAEPGRPPDWFSQKVRGCQCSPGKKWILYAVWKAIRLQNWIDIRLDKVKNKKSRMIRDVESSLLRDDKVT